MSELRALKLDHRQMSNGIEDFKLNPPFIFQFVRGVEFSFCASKLIQNGRQRFVGRIDVREINLLAMDAINKRIGASDLVF